VPLDTPCTRESVLKETPMSHFLSGVLPSLPQDLIYGRELVSHIHKRVLPSLVLIPGLVFFIFSRAGNSPSECNKSPRAVALPSVAPVSQLACRKKQRLPAQMPLFARQVIIVFKNFCSFGRPFAPCSPLWPLGSWWLPPILVSDRAVSSARG
jgi:hypothetical protein